MFVKGHPGWVNLLADSLDQFGGSSPLGGGNGKQGLDLSHGQQDSAP